VNVLVSAYACEPGEGSEPGAGWAFVRAAALRHDVWLLTRSNLAPVIEPARQREPELKLHPVYLDLPPWVLRWKRGLRGVHWYYPLWQLAAWRHARRLQRQVRFELAHHVTFAADWMPAGVGWLRDVPLVWGPIGGTTGVPWTLWRWLGWRGFLSEAIRGPVTWSGRQLFGRPVARRAALVVAQNHDVAKAFGGRQPVVVEPNVAMDGPAATPARRGASGPMARRRALFAGRLLAWKGIRLAVAAVARPEAAGWSLDIYGGGPEADAVIRLARRLGVTDRVVLHGVRSRGEVLAAMAQADALLYPSMHDAASWVVAEALSLGCPVVCLDRGGPAVLVGPGEGVKVPITRDVVADLASALSSLPPDRGLPVTRWSADRLSMLVSSWYERAARTRLPSPRP
jgi:glycosyltransferase involved in cell wall biosynthesis